MRWDVDPGVRLLLVALEFRTRHRAFHAGNLHGQFTVPLVMEHAVNDPHPAPVEHLLDLVALLDELTRSQETALPGRGLLFANEGIAVDDEGLLVSCHGTFTLAALRLHTVLDLSGETRSPIQGAARPNNT